MSKKWIWISALIVPLVFFQNCAKTDFASTDSLSAKADGGFLIADGSDGQGGITIEDNAPPSKDKKDKKDCNKDKKDRVKTEIEAKDDYKESMISACRNLSQKSHLVVKTEKDLSFVINGKIDRFLVDGSEVKSIAGLKGNIIIKGDSKGLQLDEISNGVGGLVLCNMHVDSLKNLRGNVVLVNSSVRTVEGLNGVIHLIDGSQVTGSSDLLTKISRY